MTAKPREGFSQTLIPYPRSQHGNGVRVGGGDRTGPGRVAQLRNLGVASVSGIYVAFLDDDNEWRVNHLISLLHTALENESPAVHSHLTLHWPDGRPYLEQRLLWARSPDLARKLYQELVKKGVYEPGSNIVRDRVDSHETADPVRSVDMGAWLFDRRLLLRHPFCENYTNTDWEEIVTEDDKLIDSLVSNGVPIRCTYQPTLKYYVGGYSNNFGDTVRGTWRD